jgi:hypothetical protein
MAGKKLEKIIFGIFVAGALTGLYFYQNSSQARLAAEYNRDRDSIISSCNALHDSINKSETTKLDSLNRDYHSNRGMW